MNYAILRVQKLKTDTAVRGSLKHSFREQNTPNADPERQDDNTHIGAGDVKEAMKAYKERLPEKVRKNGVRCVEYLMTASPEKMNDMTREQQDAFFKSSLDWLKEKHGSENVVYSGVHRDETTPHMYAYVVPLSQERDDQGNLKKPGRLNCREFLGGRQKLTEMQTDFAEKVGKQHGLKRGEERSRAKHTTIKEYYTRVKKAEAVIPKVKAEEFIPQKVGEDKKMFTTKDIYESPQQIKERVMPKVEEEMKALGAMMEESTAKMRDAKSKQAKAEKSLQQFQGIEGYSSLSEEEKQFMQSQLKRLQVKKEMDNLRNKTDQKQPQKPKDKGLER